MFKKKMLKNNLLIFPFLFGSGKSLIFLINLMNLSFNLQLNLTAKSKLKNKMSL